MSGITPFQGCFSSVPPCTETHNELYIVTNEADQEGTLEKAAKYPVVAGKVLLFVSGFFGLNLAAARGNKETSSDRIEYLLCVDYSTSAELFWNNLRDVISTNSRKDTIEKINHFVLDNAPKLFSNTCCSNCALGKARAWAKALNEEIDQKESWLSSDETFTRIQGIFQRQNFAFIRGNMCDSAMTSSVAKVLQERDLSLDTIYMSNVREYAESDHCLGGFRSAMEKLQPVCKPETFVVDTKPRAGALHNHEPLTQQVRRGFHKARMEEAFVDSPPCPPSTTSKKSFKTLTANEILSLLFEEDSDGR